MSVWRVTPFVRGSSRPPAETSRLAPVRDSDSIFKQWRKLRESMHHQQNHASQQTLARTSMGRDLWQWQPDVMHPFKIYRFPIEMQRRRLPLADLQKAWRTFRVRGGYVFTTTAEGIEVGGTDLIYDFPYQQALFTLADGTATNQVLVDNIIVPEDTQYFYFWVELKADGTAAGMRWHTDPTQNFYVDVESSSGISSWESVNPWAGWPTPDDQHFLIGWVDTKTQKRLHRALPRQVQTTDILFSGGGGGSCAIYG